MKSSLKITIETSLLNAVTKYAAKNKLSVNELVERYFQTITRHSKQKNIIELINKLDKPTINDNADLKELYYKEK